MASGSRCVVLIAGTRSTMLVARARCTMLVTRTRSTMLVARARCTMLVTRTRSTRMVSGTRCARTVPSAGAIGVRGIRRTRVVLGSRSTSAVACSRLVVRSGRVRIVFATSSIRVHRLARRLLTIRVLRIPGARVVRGTGLIGCSLPIGSKASCSVDSATQCGQIGLRGSAPASRCGPLRRVRNTVRHTRSRTASGPRRRRRQAVARAQAPEVRRRVALSVRPLATLASVLRRGRTRPIQWRRYHPVGGVQVLEHPRQRCRVRSRRW
jgi:hypothetical protein